MEKKVWFKSWTIWFNLIVIALDTFNAVAKIVPIPAGVVSYVATIGNIILRFKTSNGLGFKKDA